MQYQTTKHKPNKNKNDMKTKFYYLVIIDKYTRIELRRFCMTRDYFMNEFSKEKADTITDDFCTANNLKRDLIFWEIQ